METTSTNTHYDAMDGIRAFSAIGIVVMHVLSNGKYALSGFVFTKLIPSFTNLVFLFMIISAFSMCCGYYEKIGENKISLDQFYKKRFLKILPFFGLLSLVDVIISPSKEALLELFANLTLCFGFLPDAGDISVIGVGWFLGVVCIFYIIFPFYCCLLKGKLRAWAVLVLTYLFNVICADYFGIGRTNILYDAVYLVCGGLIYLYRGGLTAFSKSHRIASGLLVVVFLVTYYVVDTYVLTTLCLYSSILIYALGARSNSILSNRFTKCLSSISMEIYLCHMVCFRIVERLGLTQLFENDLSSFVMTTVFTLAGAVIFATIAQRGLTKTWNITQRCMLHIRKNEV